MLNCPQCRTSISNMPVLNVTLQQTLDAFLDLLHKKDLEVVALLDAKDECLNDYKNDLANNNLYRKVFQNTALAVMDDDDGVSRCSNCNWEVEGVICPHCNARMRNRVNEEELNSDEYSEAELEEIQDEVDEYRVRSAEFINNLEVGINSDSDEGLADELNRRFPLRQPRDFLHQEHHVETNSYSNSNCSVDDHSYDEYSDEFDSALDEFIVNDDDDDENSDLYEDEYKSSVSSSPVRQSTNLNNSSTTHGSTSDITNSDIESLATQTSKTIRNKTSDISSSGNSDYYEYNDEEFFSGDSLNKSVPIDSHKHHLKQTKKRKRKYMVIESDED